MQRNFSCSSESCFNSHRLDSCRGYALLWLECNTFSTCYEALTSSRSHDKAEVEFLQLLCHCTVICANSVILLYVQISFLAPASPQRITDLACDSCIAFIALTSLLQLHYELSSDSIYSQKLLCSFWDLPYLHNGCVLCLTWPIWRTSASEESIMTARILTSV